MPNWVIGGFLNIFFLNLGLTGVMEKCVGCFLVYLLFFLGGGDFFIKRYYRVGDLIFCVKLIRQNAAIHATAYASTTLRFYLFGLLDQ